MPGKFFHDINKAINKSGFKIVDDRGNPLNLPIPQLKIAMAIELRLGRAGSKLDKTLGVDVASGNIRAQGRLDSKTKIQSPYSLDKPGDFLKLFGNVSAKDLGNL